MFIKEKLLRWFTGSLHLVPCKSHLSYRLYCKYLHTSPSQHKNMCVYIGPSRPN